MLPKVFAKNFLPIIYAGHHKYWTEKVLLLHYVGIIIYVTLINIICIKFPHSSPQRITSNFAANHSFIFFNVFQKQLHYNQQNIVVPSISAHIQFFTKKNNQIQLYSSTRTSTEKYIFSYIAYVYNWGSKLDHMLQSLTLQW